MSNFDAGVFTVGSTVTLNFDYLLDGGSYQGQLAIFNIQGMEQYSAGSTAFIQEAARRVLTESNLGHIVIDDIAVGAKFKANIPWEGDSNRGTYSGIKTVTMNPGDQFGLMLVPNNTIQYIYNNPSATSNGATPIFSLGTPNTSDTLTGLQMVDVTGNNTAFAWEDIRLDSSFSDSDYNDVIFQMTGAASNNTPLLDDKINPARDWRTIPVGQKILTSLYFPPSIELREQNNFTTTWSKTFEIAPGTSQLSFTIDNLSFDTADSKSIKDAFEAALIDENGNSLVHTTGIGKNAFFNYTEGQSTALATGVTFSNKIVSLNLSALPKGTQPKLILKLVNNDRDVNTIARISNLEIKPNTTFSPPVAVPFTKDSTAASKVDFSKLSDVSNSITATYGQTSFNEDTDILYTDLAVKNAGQYPLKGTLLVGVTNISDPNVRLLNADGTTPAGISYVDYSKLLASGTLAPTLSTTRKTLLFDNPGGVQFTYDLVFLSQVNSKPEFTTNPDVEAIVGKPYIYDADATDADKDSLTYSVLSGPDGLVVDSATGKITWNPSAGDIGKHNIIIKVKDNFGGETTQQYNLSTINPPPNRPPLFTSIPIVDAKVNTPYKYEAKAKDDDGNPLTFSLLEAPAGMTVNPNTGVLTWMPDGHQVDKVNIKLKVEDSAGGTAEQSYQILNQIEPGNHAPFILSEPITAVNVPIGYTNNIEDNYTYNVRALDPDSDSLTYKLIVHPEGMKIDSEKGTISWNPTENAVGTHQITVQVSDGRGGIEGHLGENSITVIASDGRGGEATQTFNLNVVQSAPNSDPVITSTPRKNIGLGNNYFYQVGVSDINGDPLTYALESHPVGMTIDEEGKIFWKPTSAQFGNNNVILKVNDGRGGVAVQEFAVNVVSFAANQPPSINSTPSLTATVNSSYEYNLTGNDPEGDPLLWSLDTAPDGMSIDSQRGTIRWTPTAEQVGEHEVAVRVMDAVGAYVGQVFTVAVRGVNVAPTITSLPPTTAAVNKAYKYAVLASDLENDKLNFSLSNPLSGMTINRDTGLIDWTPTTGLLGEQNLEVIVEDSSGGIVKQSYKILVKQTAGNLPPAITSTPKNVASVGQSYQYAVTATDPSGETPLIQLLEKPAGMTFNQATGKVQWTPTQAGVYSVTVGATDSSGAGGAQQFDINVAVNQIPKIISTPVESVTRGKTYRYDVKATDGNGDVLVYSLTNPIHGMEIDPKGRISWSPANTGSFPVSVTVTDSRGVGVGVFLNLII